MIKISIYNQELADKLDNTPLENLTDNEMIDILVDAAEDNISALIDKDFNSGQIYEAKDIIEMLIAIGWRPIDIERELH